MRQRGDVFDRLDLQPGRLQGRDRAFPAAAGSLHLHVDFLDAELRRLFGRLLGGKLTGKRRALAASLEPARAGARPAERVALRVGDRHRRVVERRLDESNPHRHVAAGLASFGERTVFHLPPRNRSGHLHDLLLGLERLKPGGIGSASSAISEVGAGLRRRGRVVLLSDCLEVDDGASLLGAVGQLRARGDEVIVIRIVNSESEKAN